MGVIVQVPPPSQEVFSHLKDTKDILLITSFITYSLALILILLSIASRLYVRMRIKEVLLIENCALFVYI